MIVIESADEVGGQWYFKNGRSSMYQSLRTNIPREIMSFSTQSFEKVHVDGRQYPGHEEIFQYLKEYAEDVRASISFGEEVWDVKHVSLGMWEVQTSKRSLKADAVCVCNGRLEKPNLPEIEGIETFKGELFHSHDYKC